MSKYLISPVLVELFYDVLSPYSFLAFEVLCRYKTKWNINLKLKPFYLPGIMKLSGNQPPSQVANRGIYMIQDLKRLQKYFQVPLYVPENIAEVMFNKGSLNAQRFITAVDMVIPEHTESISRSLWLRLYETHEDITEYESLKQAGIRAGLKKEEIHKCLSMINEQQTKERLKHYTQQAYDYGSFGAPTIIAHIGDKPQMFFGSDRFELLANCLGEKWLGPVPPSSL